MERLVHRVPVASLVLVGLLTLGGCVGRHYVNQTLYGPTEEPQIHTDPMIVPSQ